MSEIPEYISGTLIEIVYSLEDAEGNARAPESASCTFKVQERGGAVVEYDVDDEQVVLSGSNLVARLNYGSIALDQGHYFWQWSAAGQFQDVERGEFKILPRSPYTLES